MMQSIVYGRLFAKEGFVNIRERPDASSRLITQLSQEGVLADIALPAVQGAPYKDGNLWIRFRPVATMFDLWVAATYVDFEQLVAPPSEMPTYAFSLNGREFVRSLETFEAVSEILDHLSLQLKVFINEVKAGNIPNWK